MITRRKLVGTSVVSLLASTLNANPFDLPIFDADPRFPLVVSLRPKDWPTLFNYKYRQGDWPAVSGLALNEVSSEHIDLRQLPTIISAASVDWLKHLHNPRTMEWAFDTLQTTIENKFFLNEWRLIVDEISEICVLNNKFIPKSAHLFLDERTEVKVHAEQKVWRSNMMDIGGEIRQIIKERFRWIDDGGDEVRMGILLEDERREVYAEPYSNSIDELDDRYEVRSSVRRGYLSGAKKTKLLLLTNPRDRFGLLW